MMAGAAYQVAKSPSIWTSGYLKRVMPHDSDFGTVDFTRVQVSRDGAPLGYSISECRSSANTRQWAGNEPIRDVR